MADLVRDTVEVSIFVQDPSGTYKEIGFLAGQQVSVPIVICDYTNPTYYVGVDSNGRLKGISFITDEDGHIANVTSDKYLHIKGYGTVKFVELFENNSIDITNKWIEVITGSASKSFLSTQLLLSVTTNASDSISYTAKQDILPATGQSWNAVLWVVNLGSVNHANNITEWGVKNGNNGYLFRAQGTTLKAVAINAGSENIIDLTFPTAYVHKYVIRRTGLTSAEFFVDDVLVGFINYTTDLRVGNKYDTLYVANKNIDAIVVGITRNIISCAVIDEASSGIEIIGIDSFGLKKNVKVSSEGRLQVELVSALANTTLPILFERAHSAINANEWQEVMEYTVPAEYNLNVLAFDAQSQFAGEAVRAVYKKIMGTFNCSTDTFIDGGSTVLPRFATRLYVYVTTAIGAGSNDIFTVTYTNNQNVTGRIGSVTIIKSSLVGTRVEVTLQSGDYGLINITNITHSATGQAGVVQFGGYIELQYLTLTANNTQYQSASIALGGIVVFSGETIYLQYLAGTKTNYIRRMNLLTALVPS